MSCPHFMFALFPLWFGCGGEKLADCKRRINNLDGVGVCGDRVFLLRLTLDPVLNVSSLHETRTSNNTAYQQRKSKIDEHENENASFWKV